MNLAKNLLDRCGLYVRWAKNVEAGAQRQWEEKWADEFRFLQPCNIQTILDIGANTGQFAKMVRHVCPAVAEIHSFEPLQECQGELKRALGGFTGHFVHQFGLGDKNEFVELNHSSFSPCSSLLQPNELMLRNRPDAEIIRKETIPIKRLDDWAKGYPLLGPLLIKIDVQGYEDKVILGGEKTLAKARFVIVEMPLYPLYNHQPTFHDIYTLLHDRGFVFRGNGGQNISKTDYRILESDAIFENQKLIAGL